MRIRHMLFGLAAAYCTAAQAADESARRLAAELAIMAGDARKISVGAIGPQERRGLIERLTGAMSALPLALRRAGADAKPLAELRDALRRNDWPAYATRLESLAQHHVFDAGFLSVPPTTQLIAAGAALHKEVCATCHDADWGDVRLPAKDLKVQRASMSRTEFAARLWLGVRGTRDTAYANPFSDTELAALLAWYGKTH